MYPLFIDTYYHMGVIEGFSQAGGVTTRAFWELAPGGRVHIYPPSLHVIGYFLSLVGMSPRTYITLVSAFCYVGCMLTTWIWLRRIIGAARRCSPLSFCADRTVSSGPRRLLRRLRASWSWPRLPSWHWKPSIFLPAECLILS